MVVGPLGSFTIVGSASFNLFIISAVCCAGMPQPPISRLYLAYISPSNQPLLPPPPHLPMPPPKFF